MSSFRSLAFTGFPSGYSKSVCVRLHSESSERMILFSQTTPAEHPPTPPPCLWPALITLPTSPSFRSFGAASDVLLPSCLVKHGLTDAPLLVEYRFQVTRVAPSTLQLRSKGRRSLPRPCLASSAPSLPSCSLPRFLHHASLPSFHSPRPSSISPPGRVAKQAAGFMT